MVKMIIDMMGGDNGSKATVDAVLKFLDQVNDAQIIAVGNEEELSLLKGKCKIIPSSEVLPMECSVMQAMRAKDSSMQKAVRAVIEESADAIVSCGSTGAFLSLSTLIIKKMDGVDRPALVSPFPTRIKNKQVLLLDVGASNDNSAQELAQFAKMGQAYYKAAYDKENPNFYLICNGTEEGKGTKLCKDAYEIMKPMSGFNGYIEGRDVLKGEADVVVFDGFTGNVFLKTAEGVAKMMSAMIKDAFTSSASSKIGYLFAKKGFNEMRSTMDYKRVGGAMLLGVNRIVVKAHGNSDESSFCASMLLAYRLAKNDMVKKVKDNLK